VLFTKDKYHYPLLFLFSVINCVFVSLSFKETLPLLFGVLKYEVYYWALSTALLSILYLFLFYKVEKYGRKLRVVKRDFYHRNLLTVMSLNNVLALNISVLIMFYILSLSAINQVDIFGYTTIGHDEINNFHFTLNLFYRGMTFYAFVMPFIVLLRWSVNWLLGLIKNALMNKEKTI
tara:strand:+ start:838 stop:1368 length:531 start_codon:yes stop_codon:yes gene_type:complete